MRDGIRYTATHPGIAALLVLLVALGCRRTTAERVAAGICRRRVPLGGRRPVDPRLGDRRRRHPGAGSGSATVPRASEPRDMGRARELERGRAGRHRWRLRPVSMWVAVPAVVVFGCCMSTRRDHRSRRSFNSPRAGNMRGRVMGLYGLIFRGAPAIGALAAGVASAQFGLRWPVFFGALLVIAACLWTYRSRERIAAGLSEPELMPRREPRIRLQLCAAGSDEVSRSSRSRGR